MLRLETCLKVLPEVWRRKNKNIIFRTQWSMDIFLVVIFFFFFFFLNNLSMLHKHSLCKNGIRENLVVMLSCFLLFFFLNQFLNFESVALLGLFILLSKICVTCIHFHMVFFKWLFYFWSTDYIAFSKYAYVCSSALFCLDAKTK